MYQRLERVSNSISVKNERLSKCQTKIKENEDIIENLREENRKLMIPINVMTAAVARESINFDEYCKNTDELRCNIESVER